MTDTTEDTLPTWQGRNMHEMQVSELLAVIKELQRTIAKQDDREMEGLQALIDTMKRERELRQKKSELSASSPGDVFVVTVLVVLLLSGAASTLLGAVWLWKAVMG